MSKELLIVICDFLLLSLLSLARFDAPPEPAKQSPTAVADYSTANQDISATLKMALEQERQTREELRAQLSQTQQSLQEKETQLNEREERIRAVQGKLQEQEQASQRLDRERASLQKQFAATRDNMSQLQQQLSTTSTEAQLTKTQLEAMRNELRKREAEANQLQAKLSNVDQARQEAEAEKQKLAGQLKVSEVETRLTRRQLDDMRGQVQEARQEVTVVRQEKELIQQHATQLAKGVNNLAEKSQALTEEIRQNRPLTPNTIFTDFLTNRLQSYFHGRRSGLFGWDVNKDKTPRTILVNDGVRTYALYHVRDIPLHFEIPGTDWDGMTAQVRSEGVMVPVEQLLFSAIDPRLILAPIPERQARRLGTKIYAIDPQPYKYQEAILVGADEGYYGECRFQIDPNTPQYVKMDRSMLRGLFGKFNPSTGDFVFSKTGELLGVMVNNEYCALLQHARFAASLQLGQDISQQKTSLLLSQLAVRLENLPLRLQ